MPEHGHKINVQAGGRWDSMDYVQCTSGHRIDSSMKQGCESLAGIKPGQWLSTPQWAAARQFQPVWAYSRYSLTDLNL